MNLFSVPRYRCHPGLQAAAIQEVNVEVGTAYEYNKKGERFRFGRSGSNWLINGRP
jgi:hypothetical protein